MCKCAFVDFLIFRGYMLELVCCACIPEQMPETLIRSFFFPASLLQSEVMQETL